MKLISVCLNPLTIKISHLLLIEMVPLPFVSLAQWHSGTVFVRMPTRTLPENNRKFVYFHRRVSITLHLSSATPLLRNNSASLEHQPFNVLPLKNCGGRTVCATPHIKTHV